MHGTSGMDTIRKMYKPDKMLLVGGGGLPWQEFLKILHRAFFNERLNNNYI